MRRDQFPLTIVCFLFGLALMMQLRTQDHLRQAATGESSADLAAIAADLYDNNTTLRQEVDNLLNQQLAYQRSVGSDHGQAIQQEVQRLEAFNGVVPVTGPGIEVSIDAALQPVDVEDFLNELRNAGAEAIAVNGQRVVFNTSVGGSTGHVTVNGVAITPPVVFDAIGAAPVLNRAIGRKGGMLSYLRTTYPRARVVLAEHELLRLPAYTRSLPIRSVQEGTAGQGT